MEFFVFRTNSALFWLKLTPSTHHRLLNVNLLATGQAKVCYLCHEVVAYKDIPSSQISVDELVPGEWRSKEILLLVKHEHELQCNATRYLTTEVITITAITKL